MSDLLARLGRCFAAVFPDLGPAEIPRASLTSVATWDSLASITLLSVLEEEFGVQIDPGEFAELVSFELILDYLRTEKHVS